MQLKTQASVMAAELPNEKKEKKKEKWVVEVTRNEEKERTRKKGHQELFINPTVSLLCINLPPPGLGMRLACISFLGNGDPASKNFLSGLGGLLSQLFSIFSLEGNACQMRYFKSSYSITGFGSSSMCSTSSSDVITRFRHVIQSPALMLCVQSASHKAQDKI